MATNSAGDTSVEFGVPAIKPFVSPTAPIPPLEQGDRLTREEFERRYEAMPHVKKAELIEGIVYMPSPVSYAYHARPHLHLLTWLGMYVAHTPGASGGDNATVKFDSENEPQPDALLLLDSAHGGQCTIDEKGYIIGSPELLAEISSTTVSDDLNAKFNVYRRNGVKEYIVWRVREQAIDWFALRNGEYHLLPADEHGVVRSEIFPGLWLNVPAMLAGKLDIVLATLQEGIAARAT